MVNPLLIVRLSNGDEGGGTRVYRLAVHFANMSNTSYMLYWFGCCELVTSLWCHSLASSELIVLRKVQELT